MEHDLKEKVQWQEKKCDLVVMLRMEMGKIFLLNVDKGKNVGKEWENEWETDGILLQKQGKSLVMKWNNCLVFIVYNIIDGKKMSKKYLWETWCPYF